MKEIMEKYKKQIKEALDDLKTPGSRHKQIPNLLTASRLLSPLIIIPSVLTGNFILAGISTALFSVTDLFDGFVARKFNVTSELGKDLDAFTDKVFAGTLMIALTIINPFYVLPLLMELSIAGINIKKKINDENPESHLIGKIKMTALYSLLALGYLNLYVNVPSKIITTLFMGTIGLQTATIIEYSRKENNIEMEKEKEIIDIKTDEEANSTEKNLVQNKLQQYRNYKELLEEYKNTIETNEIEKPKQKIKIDK